MGYSDYHQPYIKPPTPPPRPPRPGDYNKGDPFGDNDGPPIGLPGWGHWASKFADKWIYNNRYYLAKQAQVYGPMAYRWANSPQGRQILGQLEGLLL